MKEKTQIKDPRPNLHTQNLRELIGSHHFAGSTKTCSTPPSREERNSHHPQTYSGKSQRFLNTSYKRMTRNITSKTSCERPLSKTDMTNPPEVNQSAQIRITCHLRKNPEVELRSSHKTPRLGRLASRTRSYFQLQNTSSPCQTTHPTANAAGISFFQTKQYCLTRRRRSATWLHGPDRPGPSMGQSFACRLTPEPFTRS